MDIQEAERLAQRAALVGVARELFLGFSERKYWRERFKRLEPCSEYYERLGTDTAYWKTTIGANKRQQQWVEWVIHFRHQSLGTLTIKFQDGNPRSFLWQRVTIGRWELNVRWSELPPLIDSEEFYHLLGMFSTASARYLKRLASLGKDSAHLLQVLD